MTELTSHSSKPRISAADWGNEVIQSSANWNIAFSVILILECLNYAVFFFSSELEIICTTSGYRKSVILSGTLAQASIWYCFLEALIWHDYFWENPLIFSSLLTFLIRMLYCVIRWRKPTNYHWWVCFLVWFLCVFQDSCSE